MWHRPFRFAVGVCTLLLTAHATAELARVLSPQGDNAIELLGIALFAPCFAWTTFGALIGVLGLFAVPFSKRTRSLTDAAMERAIARDARTAVLIPIHNEDPDFVVGHLEVMLRGMEAQRGGQLFDFYLLSDSTQADIWLAEQAAWRSLCERLGAFGRVFYRRRAKAEGKKAGNIREFCLRHGGKYRYLIVLDADSVIAPEIMCELVARMEENPRFGIIQIPPLPVRRRTLFARWQQFAARVYGPSWGAAERLLSGPDGNYYGHNAIMRSEAFCGHAGLGKLPGSGPLSGLISSHDFVEAALIRRAGYEVWLAPELSGSYEQCPTTLVDYAIRDKRWCRGNLQHLRTALLPGVTPWSRMHFLRGAFSYLIPPLWLAFVSIMLLVAAHDLSVKPEYFLPSQRTLFPMWPVYDFVGARNLLLLILGMLLGPRLLAAAFMLVRMLHRREMPVLRVPAFLASVLVEWAMGALLAPPLMVFQATFVLSSLLGERVPWLAQRRNEHRVTLGEAFRWHFPHVVAALVLGAASLLVSNRALAYMSPVLLPLLASPLLTIITSSRTLARLFDGLGILQVPEDWSKDPLLASFDMPPTPAPPSAMDVLKDRSACAHHALAVIGSRLLRRIPDEERIALKERLSSDHPLEPAQMHACLTDTEILLERLAPRTASGDRLTGLLGAK